MYRLTIESNTQEFDTLDAMVIWLKANYDEPLSHAFTVDKQVDGAWIPNPDKFSLL